ncbi:MAG: bacteriohemerythrin [Terracidiphilus sp.]|nr:bacteriohemerythrin [Terracidiphilus sp.]MDR3776311.1 bacteriohemerythrin [Terracidiphilus sp.]
MTLLVAWKHTCSVDVRAMDDEHAIMIDAMNELRQALVNDSKQAAVNEQMNKLIDFTRMHFRNEENLLAQFDFPGLPKQKSEHQRLLAQLQDSLHRQQQGQAVSTSALLGFLHDWFLDHVEGEDRKYGPWLNSHGVK